MSLIRINTRPGRRQLLLFGALWLVVLGSFGFNAWTAQKSVTAVVFWSLAAGGALPGLFYPPWLRWLFIGACYATFPIGFVVSHVILAAIYYLVLTPIGLALRAFGRDPLSRRFDSKAATYWKVRRTERPAGSYFRQY